MKTQSMAAYFFCILTWVGLLGCSPTSNVGSQGNRPAPTKPPQTGEKPTPEPQPPTEDPTQPIKVQAYTRIMCHPTFMGGAPFLETYLTNAPYNFTPKMLSFADSTGNSLKDIRNIQILSGNEGSFDFILSNYDHKTESIILFFGNMNLLYGKADLKQLASAPVSQITNGNPTSFEIDEYPDFVGFSRNSYTLLIPDPKGNQYVLKNSFSDQTIGIIPISPSAYFNPQLSDDGNLALFQTQIDGHNVNIAYSIFDGKMNAFPKEQKNSHQLPAKMINGMTFSWVEKTTTGLLLKAATWEDLTEKKSRTLAQISKTDLASYTVGVQEDSLMLVQALEKYELQTDISNGTTNIKGKRTSNGKLNIREWKFSATDPANHFTELPETEIPYSEEMKSRVLNTSHSLIKRILYSQWSKEWIATTSQGLVVYNYSKKEWKPVAKNPGAECFSPIIGPEYHIESDSNL